MRNKIAKKWIEKNGEPKQAMRGYHAHAKTRDTVSISLRIPASLLSQLRDVSTETGCKMGSIIRHLIKESLVDESSIESEK